jgi:hypothetical protein
VPASGHEALNTGSEFMLRHATLQAQLWRDARQQARLSVGQIIVRWLAIKYDRLADLPPSIGTNAPQTARGPPTPGFRSQRFRSHAIKGVHRGRSHILRFFYAFRYQTML